MILAPSYRHCCRCESATDLVPVQVIESGRGASGRTLWACAEHAPAFPPLEQPAARHLPERNPLPPITLAV